MASLGVYEFDMSTGHRELVGVVGHAKRGRKAAAKFARRTARKLKQFATADKATDHTYYTAPTR